MLKNSYLNLLTQTKQLSLSAFASLSEDRKKKKLAYDTKYQATEKRKNYRVKLNKANRDAGTYGNGDNLDMSHTQAGSMVTENMKSNRRRNGQNGKSTKKW